MNSKPDAVTIQINHKTTWADEGGRSSLYLCGLRATVAINELDEWWVVVYYTGIGQEWEDSVLHEQVTSRVVGKAQAERAITRALDGRLIEGLGA